jgi:serine/threonine protein kinase
MGQGAARLEDRYFVQKVKLGQGAFGVVWRAVDRQTNRIVALKQLDKAALPRRGVKRQDIEREINMMTKCSHENVTELFDTFEDDKFCYLALEYCDGGDFGDKLNERGMAILESETVFFMRQICAAISALHSKSITHRDIKPDNFMIKMDGANSTLKLADFGLAMHLPQGKRLKDKCGTPAFMAPEQHLLPKHSKGYGLAVDVWAAGISMYMVMFGGRHPFMNNGHLDEKLLVGGQLDFRENPSSVFFGFDLGVGGLRYSEATRQLCAQMVTADERARVTASDALRQPVLWKAGLHHGPAAPTEPVAMGAATQAGNLRPVNSEARVLRDENSALKAKLGIVSLQQQNQQQWSGPPPKQRASTPALPAGTRCRYLSSTHNWVRATVQSYNPHTGTYDLDVKLQVTPDKISPGGETSAEAWLAGTQVVYNSTSTSKWLPTVVNAFNDSDGTYNLGVREHAHIDRIRMRGGDLSQLVDDSPSTSAGSSGVSVPPAELRVSDLQVSGWTPNSRTSCNSVGLQGGLQRSPAMNDRLQYGYQTSVPR